MSAPPPRPRLLYRYDMTGASLAGEDRHPQVVIREAFPDATDFEPVPIADCWMFRACARVARDYFVVVGEQLGGTLSWESPAPLAGPADLCADCRAMLASRPGKMAFCPACSTKISAWRGPLVEVTGTVVGPAAPNITATITASGGINQPTCVLVHCRYCNKTHSVDRTETPCSPGAWWVEGTGTNFDDLAATGTVVDQPAGNGGDVHSVGNPPPGMFDVIEIEPGGAALDVGVPVGVATDGRIVFAPRSRVPGDHPAPWRWERGERMGRGWWDLRDADGAFVLRTAMDWGHPPIDHQPSPRVRELVRAAPEMAAMLRRLLAAAQSLRAETSDVVGLEDERRTIDAAEALLARIDERSKG